MSSLLSSCALPPSFLSVCVLPQCFTPFITHCFPLSVCLFGMVWLVLIYSLHYLVLREDKHAFACLMNQTPPIPLTMRTHTCTEVGTHTHTHTRKPMLLTLQASVGPTVLCLLAADMESTAADSFRNKYT